MCKYIVAGNWKMHGSKSSVEKLLREIKEGVGNIIGVDWIVFPPYPFLAQAEEILGDSGDIFWGGQNLSDRSHGAYTGEVSAEMLKDFGCSYVLIGHSERRNLYNEDNKLIADKFKIACNSGLTPILCVGETLQERNNGLTQQIVKDQLNSILDLHDKTLLHNMIIAYEPVWAIGTGVTATPNQAQEVHKAIRSQVSKYDVEVAKRLRILYGGSVKPGNAKEIFAMPDIDGGLIGGASLNSDDFLEIGKSCNN